MQAYYNILEVLKTQLEADKFCNTVTEGDLFEVDLVKQTIFPLSHIIVNEMTKEANILVFSVSILCMDIVDKSKDEALDKFRGNDNEQDVINTQMAVALRLVEVLERGGDNKTFMMRGTPTFEPFTERFKNYLAGVTVTFDIHVPNTMSACDSVNTPEVCKPATYLVEYEDGTEIESGSVSSGGSVTVQVPNAALPAVGATIMPTNQTVSYGDNDDGDLRLGRQTDFFTLENNNPFGTTDRFSDELGTQVYSNNVIIDWSTYDNVAETVLGWYTGDSSTPRNWVTAKNTAAATSVGTYTSGWFLPNIRQYQSILNYGLTSLLNYAPFNYAFGLSTSTSKDSNSMYLVIPQQGNAGQPFSKLTGYRHFAARIFTVTGTTLT